MQKRARKQNQIEWNDCTTPSDFNHWNALECILGVKDNRIPVASSVPCVALSLAQLREDCHIQLGVAWAFVRPQRLAYLVGHQCQFGYGVSYLNGQNQL